MIEKIYNSKFKCYEFIQQKNKDIHIMLGHSINNHSVNSSSTTDFSPNSTSQQICFSIVHILNLSKQIIRYTSDKFIIDKDKGGAYCQINQGKLMKGNLLIIKKEEQVLKFIQMVISIKESSRITKNMGKEFSIGSVFPLKIQNQYNHIMENGGVVFLMVLVCILVQMVIIILEDLKMG